MVGELVMGRFRVRERIGGGGAGTVYRAFDERLQRDVAVKEVPAADPVRVRREAQAAARLNHPGIVTLYELGEHDGRALLVSELVAGMTLAELGHEGDLSDRDVAEIGADVCEALAHAHDRGVIHRDIKPQNVIVRDEDGAGRRGKLMDFGIASVAGSERLTETGEVVGTLAYMAPEQAEGDAAGVPADVYSLALTLYECWAGENPVARRTPAATARAIGAEVPPLARRRPDLPPRLATRVDACLVPEPELRPQIDELHDGLVTAIDRLDDSRPLPLVRSGPRTPGAWRAAVSRLGLVAALAGAVALLGGPGNQPGLALVLAALALPGAIVASTSARALLPAAAPLLGAISAGAVYPALVGATERRTLSRLALGALGWCWLVVVSTAAGLPPHLELATAPPHGWQGDASLAADWVLAPLAGLESLQGMATFALAAAALGWVLAARHLALAAAGALAWAAALAGALRLLGDGGLGEKPALAAVAALAAVGFAHFERRTPLSRHRATVAQPRPRTALGRPAPG